MIYALKIACCMGINIHLKIIISAWYFHSLDGASFKKFPGVVAGV
jgi:hypothetical protein